MIALGARGGSAAQAHQPIRDLDQIRSFMTGTGPIAIVDLPWIPFFLAICFLIHPWIGFLSLAGAIILIALTIQTERASRGLAKRRQRKRRLADRPWPKPAAATSLRSSRWE